MVPGKRALIVDDSRSARVILSRMLEQHGLVVDTAENAEQALDYLRRARPDVIFMDHLMPGMDGFEAVQAIKADPQTATIPLMMYTSQEGELYVSQARALGAIGVLPKTVRPVDVTRVLYQLHLMPERRQHRSALFEAAAPRAEPPAAPPPAEAPPAAGSAGSQQMPLPGLTARAAGSSAAYASTPASTAITLSELQSGLRQTTDQLLRDQFAEQRRFMLATLEAYSRRLGNEYREAVARIPVPEPYVPPPPVPPPRWPMLLTGLLAALPALVLGALGWRALEDGRALRAQSFREVADLRAALVAAEARAVEAAAAVAAASTAPATEATDTKVAGGAGVAAVATAPRLLAVERVPYGATPLAGERLDRLRTLVTELEAEGFRGRLQVHSYAGDFCLEGSVDEGYSPADASLPVRRCALIGNPFDEGLSPAEHQSVDFANFLATAAQRRSQALRIEILTGGRRGGEAYPGQDETTTAGQWNAVAGRNNRVEYTAVAEAAAPADAARATP